MFKSCKKVDVINLTKINVTHAPTEQLIVKWIGKANIISVYYTYMVECSICMNTIYDGYCLDTCNHQFDKECIVKWTITQLIKGKKPTCPLCRKVYLPPWDLLFISFIWNHYNINKIEIMNMMSRPGKKKLEDIMEEYREPRFPCDPSF